MEDILKLMKNLPDEDKKPDQEDYQNLAMLGSMTSWWVSGLLVIVLWNG